MAVPQDAIGPMPVHTGKGVQYAGGSGGHGLDPRVSNVRIMDPTPPRGRSLGYPGGDVSYSHSRGQTVHPYTGRTITPDAPFWHIPLTP
jgi:hypothetical protein